MARKLRCPDSFGFDWRVEVPDYYARRVNSFLNRFDVNTKNRFGQTLLMLLVNKGIEELVQLVISKGANVNEADKRGVTPLMIAVGANDKSIYQALLSKNADIMAEDKFDRSVLIWAIENRSDEEIIKDLIDRGAQINPTYKKGFFFLNKKRITPLMAAVRSGNEKIVKMLIERGADVTLKDRLGKKGRTALDFAYALPIFQNNTKDIVDILSKAPQIRAEYLEKHPEEKDRHSHEFYRGHGRE